MTTPAEPLELTWGKGPPLVSTDLAVAHLHLGTPLAPETATNLAQKIAAASDAIRDFIKKESLPSDPWDAAADPDTDPDLVPPPMIVAAVLLLLDQLYQNPGDQLKTSDADVWEAIGRLLMRSRRIAIS